MVFSGNAVGVLDGTLSLFVSCGGLGVVDGAVFLVDCAGSLVGMASGSGGTKRGWDDVRECACCNSRDCS